MKIKNRFAGEVIREVPGDTLTGASLTGAFMMLGGKKFFLPGGPKQ